MLSCCSLGMKNEPKCQNVGFHSLLLYKLQCVVEDRYCTLLIIESYVERTINTHKYSNNNAIERIYTVSNNINQ